MIRRFLPCLALASALWAQKPVPGDTVVATVDGKPVTAADVRTMLASAPPTFMAAYKANPARAIADIFVLRELSADADKLKLADESPWKEQIENQRMNILANAMLTHELNNYMVPENEVQKYYSANQSRFEQVSIDVIKIGFKPDMKPAGTSDEELAAAARAVVEAAHSANRAEADARKLSDEIIKKLRAGADFKPMVAQYSDDQETRDAGGKFGTISSTSAYPADLKKAALALKPGEISEPVKISVAYYILRCESRTAQPMKDVHETILREIRQQHADAFVKEIQQRLQPVVANQEALVQIGNGK